MSSTEWLELESDPGLFTLLLEDFGVKGVQVEEIYDLSEPIKETVYGFIFLFRWDNPKKKTHRRSGRGSANSSTSLLPNSGIAAPSTNCANASGTNDSTRSQKDGVSARLRSSSGSTGNSHNPREQGSGADGGSLIGLPETNELFFARQTVQNSCATHALLSILLNRPELDLGPMLSEFQKATRQLSPEAKGTAIGSMPQLAQAHNRHAAQPHTIPNQSTHPITSPLLEPNEAASAAAAATAALALTNAGSDSTSGLSTVTATTTTSSAATTATGAVNTIQLDTFHFVCYVPFAGFLYELDGLKPDPINHGPLQDPTSPSAWTRQCAAILQQRMQEQDVRYSLMAVVPDRRLALTKRMCTLDKNRQIIEDTLLRIARYEEVQKRRKSVDFRVPVNGTAADLHSPSSIGASRPNHDPPQSMLALNTDRKDPTLTSALSESDTSKQDMDPVNILSTVCVSPRDDVEDTAKHSNRSIRTRSLTRCTTGGESVSLGEPDSQSDAIQCRSALHRSDSVLLQPDNSPTSDTSGTRKRSPTASILDEDEGAWVSERKRRFLGEAIESSSCSETAAAAAGDDGVGSVAPYNQMNKMLASIVSVESPLLTTLTKMVAAAAQDVSDTLDESSQGTFQPLKQSDSSKSLSTIPDEPESDVEVHRTATRPRSSMAILEGNPLARLEDEKKQSLVKILENTHGSPNNDVRHLSFGSAYISSESELPSELTKPLTVDTQLWDHARLASTDPLESALPNGVIAPGHLVTKQTENNIPTTTMERELRPLTRALTRARVKNHSSSAGASHAKSTDCSACDAAEQPSCSNSPTTVGSPVTTRSPISPQCDSIGNKDLQTAYIPDGCSTSLSDTTSNSNTSISGIVTTTVTVSSSESARRASKYPTRSSTKRDTLASHNLANCRTSTTTAATFTCNPDCSPDSASIQVNHHGTSLRSDSSHAPVTSNSVETKMEHLESNRVYSATNRSQGHIPRFSADELHLLLSRVEEQVKLCDSALLEEEKKRQAYRVDDARRVHNYEPFIRAYLNALSRHGLLRDLVIQALQNMPNFGSSLSLLSPGVGSTSTRKSTNAIDPPYHSRRSDLDRSASGAKVSSTTDTTDGSDRCASRRGNHPETNSTSNAGSTRRGLRARSRRSALVSTSNRISTDLNNSHSGNANNEHVQGQPRLTVFSSTTHDHHATELSASGASDPNKVTTTDALPNSIDLEHPGSTPILGTETPDSAKSKCQAISPVLSNTTRNGTVDVSESGSCIQAPLSPLASSVAHTSYSSCGSAPQSPQSSTSSRSTYLRPLRQNARSDSSAKSVVEDGFISRKSLRPRSSTDKGVLRGGSQPGLSDSSDEQKSGTGHRLLLRRRNFSPLIKHDSGGACKPRPTGSSQFSTSFSQRFRKKRLC